MLVDVTNTSRYDGILAGPIDLDAPRRRGATFRHVPADRGLEVIHADSGFVGRVVSLAETFVILTGDDGRDRSFTSSAGAFLVDGERVTLVAETRRAATRAAPGRTASGSVSVDDAPARVARASRIWVEGIHDAELLEKIWGDDLRVEGIVVEQLEGVDDLAHLVDEFGPTPDRRLGVLLDHLVEGSKEQRIAGSVRHQSVLITGHPFVDVWQTVRPSTLGIEQWPEIPMGRPWKEGICESFGWTGTTRAFWVKLLRSVKRAGDLEPALVGAVEQLIDFVAPPR